VESLPRIRGFESEITLLFQNLISNALKFHRQGAKPVVKVEGQSFPDYHVFSVSDNGIGIPAEFQESVFALFQRFHSRWDYEGTGMGLAICKKIVSNHQGEIWLDSRENGGATFFFKSPQLERTASVFILRLLGQPPKKTPSSGSFQVRE
jgi:chemotaxis family two-component system sensor kinase Cph1